MFNYNKLLEVKEIKLESLDKDTLINWSILELGKDKEGLENWVSIEVWTDEGNKIRILETNDYNVQEVTNSLTEEQVNHIHKLVREQIKD